MEPRDTAYLYRAFGLNVRSEIEFPELAAIRHGDPDILIEKIDAAQSVPDENAGNGWRFDMASFRLRLMGIAGYEVRNGSRILVASDAEAPPAQVRIHLLTVCMAAVLMQRGRLLLHASGIVHNGRAVLFAGDSGAGKSSVAAELIRRGYGFLTDDTCAIETLTSHSPTLVAHASYPMLKLTSATLDMIEDPRYDRKLRIWPDTEKYGQILKGACPLDGTALGAVFILGYSGTDSPVAGCRRLTGNEAFLALTRHTYRREFIHERTLQEAHLRTFGTLAAGVPVIQAQRNPNLGLKQFCDRLEEWMADA
jgi:hypothetical protein